ncbi:hypothetical protein [Sedimenticola selenatireducens]|uniref:Uncharacterized protein n=1 Tax=Sedimenticola selenatireducens TaxID=191960 RepID=A0A557RXZ9_9GAMM|nr:hypothetical protein [Sedimenticola selenatireducens]TVO70025.1 hypothetical protein FHP88_17035 [Sedimenticola selenatireducens]TVT61733.1 MAG: hypothetical protein FHK78_16850 [Sedimenticola selenatireducens]
MDHDAEVMKVLWDEFKYRHEHYWRSFYKIGFLLLFLLSIPYITPKDFILPPEWFFNLMPIYSLALSIIATWLLWQEHKRVDAAHDKYKCKRDAPISDATNNENGRLLTLGALFTLLFGESMGSVSIDNN